MAEPFKMVVTCETCPFAHQSGRDRDLKCVHQDAPRTRGTDQWIDDSVADSGKVMPWCPLKIRPALIVVE